jgi:hypothetical protein
MICSKTLFKYGWRPVKLLISIILGSWNRYIIWLRMLLLTHRYHIGDCATSHWLCRRSRSKSWGFPMISPLSKTSRGLTWTWTRADWPRTLIRSWTIWIEKALLFRKIIKIKISPSALFWKEFIKKTYLKHF